MKKASSKQSANRSVSRKEARTAKSEEDSLIRPWGRKSALSLINGLSSVPLRHLPKPISGD